MDASTSTIAAAIADAPAWALIGLTMPDEQMRERGAEELARWIAQRLDGQVHGHQREAVLSS